MTTKQLLGMTQQDWDAFQEIQKDHQYSWEQHIKEEKLVKLSGECCMCGRGSYYVAEGAHEICNHDNCTRYYNETDLRKVKDYCEVTGVYSDYTYNKDLKKIENGVTLYYDYYNHQTICQEIAVDSFLESLGESLPITITEGAA